MIVPTGIGASIGGFAGDALPVARALSNVVDCLITHPNVLHLTSLSFFLASHFLIFLFNTPSVPKYKIKSLGSG